MSFNIADYIDVRQRVQMFIAKYPEGSLQFEFKGICEHAPDYIWGIAYAYRYPDDPRPAIGTAQELAAGRTNFTRGSELQNLETSCWGRAIGALSIGIDKSIASRDEVEFAQARQSTPTDVPDQTYKGAGNVLASPKQIALINKLTSNRNHIVDYWKHTKNYKGNLTIGYASDFIEQVTKMSDDEKHAFFDRAQDWLNDQPDPWALPEKPIE